MDHFPALSVSLSSLFSRASLTLSPVTLNTADSKMSRAFGRNQPPPITLPRSKETPKAGAEREVEFGAGSSSAGSNIATRVEFAAQLDGRV